MFRTTLALLAVTAIAVVGAGSAAAKVRGHDPWFAYAVSLGQESGPSFITDTLAPGGRSAAPTQGYRFITDTLAPGGGPNIVSAPADGGFSWTDAAIGGAAGAALVLLALAGARLAGRRGVQPDAVPIAS